MNAFFDKYGDLLAQNFGISIYMVVVSTVMAYVLGIPLGIILVLTADDGMKPNRVAYKVLDTVVNIMRSVPFLILMVVIIPFTRMLVGKSYGANATIVPLVISAAPFVARMVEQSLLEVDKGVIEAAQSMGATTFQIITKVMMLEARTSLIVGATIATATILGYSAMAGAVGGGGLGAIAIQYGYNRNVPSVKWASVILLVLLVNIVQAIGMRIAKRLDRRITS